MGYFDKRSDEFFIFPKLDTLDLDGGAWWLSAIPDYRSQVVMPCPSREADRISAKVYDLIKDECILEVERLLRESNQV